MPTLTPEQIQSIVSTLEGTSGVYDHSIEEEYGLEAGELEQLVAEYLDHCAECGWWCSTDDLNDIDNELYCTECKPEEDEDDEEEEDE